jgi:predicted acylesterase/phospholipase RssA
MASLGTRAAGNILPSFGFSGAGFLTCYHLGAADCLLKRGVLLPRGELPVYDDNNKNDNKKPVLLTGVSGGAMVATAVSIGMSPEDGMRATLNIAENSRKTGGILNHLRPG